MQPFGTLMIKTAPGSISRQELNAQITSANINKAGSDNDIEITGSEISGFTLLAKKGAEAGTDEWTHFKYNHEGPAVSQDELVSPPTHVKWASGDEGFERIGIGTRPGWRIHDGKVVYLWNSGTDSDPRINRLTMRDAYNGSLLWTKDEYIAYDLVPIVYTNKKVYLWPRGGRGFRHNPEKEIVALNDKGEEVLH